MNVLREAFSEHHALQCGFCTPGMLMTARDIVTRLPDADEKRIRLELSGNLCRCTGYVGIVEAVQSALATVKASGASAHRRPARSVRPARTRRRCRKDFSRQPAPDEAARTPQPATSPPRISTRSNGLGRARRRGTAAVVFCSLRARRGLAVLRRSRSGDAMHARRPPDQAGCKTAGPRAKSTSSSDRSSAHSRAFSKSERDDDNFRGVVRGAGRDTQKPVERARHHHLRRPRAGGSDVAGRRVGHSSCCQAPWRSSAVPAWSRTSPTI